MSFITKKHLSRRTFLRGTGVSLALPLLDSMVPASTPLAQTAARPKSRFCGIYIPHGATMDKWTPAGEGTAFQFSEILQPLEAFRDRLVVVSDLAHAPVAPATMVCDAVQDPETLTACAFLVPPPEEPSPPPEDAAPAAATDAPTD